MRIKDERVTWRTTSQEETSENLSLLGSRRKKEVIKDQLGAGDYILISKDAYCLLNVRNENKDMENPAPKITSGQQQQLKATTLQDGLNAWDYVQSKAGG